MPHHSLHAATLRLALLAEDLEHAAVDLVLGILDRNGNDL
jgi:hypothetical protein